MPTLKKITPDFLRDTIVEVRYVSALPYSILKGVLYQLLSEKYSLLPNNSPLGIWQLGPSQQLQLEAPAMLDFSDGVIKIQLDEGRIAFNSIEKYPGWKDYFQKIQEILNTVFQEGYIETFNRSGIRYISEYPDIDIFDHLNLQFSLPVMDTGYSTTIRTEKDVEQNKVIVNLLNKAKRPRGESFYSVVDIDVVTRVMNERDLNSVITRIDELHAIEKDIFVSLLKEEFIQTLNPEYQ